MEGVEVPYELPLWIIISAAVAGILLLGIIILILWKVRLPIITPLITSCISEDFESIESPHMNHFFFFYSHQQSSLDFIAVDSSD